MNNINTHITFNRILIITINNIMYYGICNIYITIDGYIRNNIDDYIENNYRYDDKCFNLISRRHLRHEDYIERYTPHKKYLYKTF